MEASLMRDLDQIASLLFAEDPRRSAEKILRSLTTEARARGGAVLSVRADRLTLFAVQDVELDQLAAVHVNWQEAQPRLAQGLSVQSGDHLLAPIREGADLVGVLYLDSPRGFDLEDTVTFRALLAKALHPPNVPVAVATYLASQPAHEMEREQLLQALQRNEWNIARVARKLGLGRPTVYSRMQRYGIERKKVPKTFKRTPVVS
jgi:ActR/RegA family two-component response regulator